MVRNHGRRFKRPAGFAIRPDSVGRQPKKPVIFSGTANLIFPCPVHEWLRVMGKLDPAHWRKDLTKQRERLQPAHRPHQRVLYWECLWGYFKWHRQRRFMWPRMAMTLGAVNSPTPTPRPASDELLASLTERCTRCHSSFETARAFERGGPCYRSRWRIRVCRST